MDKDRKVIRDLAGRYYNYAISDKNTEKIGLYKAVNDLRMIRPIFLIPFRSLPLHEMNIDGVLDLKCEDEKARKIEGWLRYQLFALKHFPCDIYRTPYYPVYKHCCIGGSYGGLQGIDPQGRHIADAKGAEVGSSEYFDTLQTEEDLDRLHYLPVSYDREGTMDEFYFAADILGDVMPVQVRGHNTLGFAPWDHVSLLRGVTPLLTDLFDRPEFMHKIARKFTDAFIRTTEEMVKYNLFDANPPEMHWTPGFSDDLAPVDDYDSVKPKSVWGRGAAQIFTSVSPAMHDEFDIQYQIEALKDFDLVYYGCCERLDDKIEILRKMKNLRKLSITPWSDINAACEKIGRDYAMSVKTNPTNVGEGFDEDVVRNELKGILDASKRNGCSLSLLLCGTYTVANKPQNVIKWAQMAADAVMNY